MNTIETGKWTDMLHNDAQVPLVSQFRQRVRLCEHQAHCSAAVTRVTSIERLNTAYQSRDYEKLIDAGQVSLGIVYKRSDTGNDKVVRFRVSSQVPLASIASSN